MRVEAKQRIVANTLVLYVRMLFIMIVTLYISRLLLQSLGVQDFGIYNVVGGVVLMFSFLNGAMASSTQRFLSYEIGCNNQDQLKAVFITSLMIHILIGVIVLILAETIGLWFLNTQMNIPLERMEAANWVYQFSILSFFISVIQVPFNACIIAHEQMKAYAYISIGDVLLKLSLALILAWITWDKLIVYACFSMSIILLITGLYVVYCVQKYSECSFRPVWHKQLFCTMSSYACWSLYGSAASMLYFQGINILLNIFFGPVINAARAIAFQINTAIYSFTTNFQMAVNPQIVKMYAANEQSDMMNLVFRSSRFSFYLLLVLSLPILFELNKLLVLWLGDVPHYTLIFSRLIIINALIDCISNPLMIAVQATGKVRLYQSIVGTILLLNLPVSYVLLKFGFTPESTVYASIGLSVVALIARLIILRDIIGLNVVDFLKSVCLRCLFVGSLCVIPTFFLTMVFEESIYRVCIVFMISIPLTSFLIYTLGLHRSERNLILERMNIFRSKLR